MEENCTAAQMRIVIWGTGLICEEFRDFLSEDVEIIAYIDSYPKSESYHDRRVYRYDEFLKSGLEYDFIVAASVYSNQIFHTCSNTELHKVIFLRPLQNTSEVERFYRNLEVLDRIAPSYIKNALLDSNRRMSMDATVVPVLDCYPIYYYDYFRYRTFELIADQLQKMHVKGNIAEVGVFKGYFARIINMKFPEDKLYLFDTFEGFDQNEAEKELNAGNCDSQFIESFKDTSVGLVLAKMEYPENCIIKKGLFPSTAENIKDTFKFVSIDVDFEDSIYASIVWFYPRLVNNGFIFIHDYNDPLLKGVSKAVERFEKKYGTLIKIPIADKCGTLIITK